MTLTHGIISPHTYYSLVVGEVLNLSEFTNIYISEIGA